MDFCIRLERKCKKNTGWSMVVIAFRPTREFLCSFKTQFKSIYFCSGGHE